MTTSNYTQLQSTELDYIGAPCVELCEETHIERQVRLWIQNTYAAHVLATDSVRTFHTLDAAAQDLLPLLQPHTQGDVVLSLRTVRHALRAYAAAAPYVGPQRYTVNETA